MKWMSVAMVATSVIFLCAAPGARAHGATKSVSAKALALRLSDMPAGYKQTASHPITDQDTVRDDHSREYITHGRITGYQTAFSNPDAIALTQVTDNTAIFKTAAGAHWGVRKAATSGSASVFLGRHLRAMSVGHLGDESVGFTVTGKAKGISITLDTLVFRVGRYDASVVGAGVTQEFRLGKLTSLAQVIARRMRAAR